MIPIYLFNASPWGSLTKGYRLLNPSSQREMREKNPYNIQRWRALLSSRIIHASWSPPTANKRILANMCTHIQRDEDALSHAVSFPLLQRCEHVRANDLFNRMRSVLFAFVCDDWSTAQILTKNTKKHKKRERHCEQLGIFLLPRKG